MNGYRPYSSRTIGACNTVVSASMQEDPIDRWGIKVARARRIAERFPEFTRDDLKWFLQDLGVLDYEDVAEAAMS